MDDSTRHLQCRTIGAAPNLLLDTFVSSILVFHTQNIHTKWLK